MQWITCEEPPSESHERVTAGMVQRKGASGNYYLDYYHAEFFDGHWYFSDENIWKRSDMYDQACWLLQEK